MEEFILSESEEDSDDTFDVYGADPVFNSKDELDDFMASCNIERGKKGSNKESKEKVFYEEQKKVKKNCTCKNCEDIWSDDFQHICCHQVKRYI